MPLVLRIDRYCVLSCQQTSPPKWRFRNNISRLYWRRIKKKSSRNELSDLTMIAKKQLIKLLQITLRQHRTIAEASAVESPIRQETIGFPAHFFARAHNFKPPGRACQPEADSPMRT